MTLSFYLNVNEHEACNENGYKRQHSQQQRFADDKASPCTKSGHKKQESVTWPSCFEMEYLTDSDLQGKLHIQSLSKPEDQLSS